MKDLLSKIDTLASEFRINAEKAIMGNKSAGVRARKISMELSERLKEFRKLSIEVSK